MPSLNWIGKDAVLNHHREVPYRLLQCEGNLSNGDPGSGNLLIEGDNLEALKALLPYYKGKVKCIYIDPPYNTGNEGWAYNDNVNSPQIKKWLGETVGVDRLDRHDRWLCMMWPRLCLLREFLSDDGLLFVSIDDVEVGHLRLLLDQVFRERNFIANIVWQKRYVANAAAKIISDMHDHILVYGNRAEEASFELVERTTEQESDYQNPDEDPRGPWRSQDLSASKPYSAGLYEIIGPHGDVFTPPPNRFWRCSEQQYKLWLADDRITFGKSGRGRPMLKRFLAEAQQGLTPVTWWPHQYAGHNKEATLELKKLFDGDSPFDTPKPVKLLRRILELAGPGASLIMDSFAGSGTTGHAVHLLNSVDQANRNFILVEMEARIARDIVAERLRRVGAQFRYCTLGETLFTADGMISGDVTRERLAHHVWFTETGEPLPHAVPEGPAIGAHHGKTIALIEGPLTVRSLRDLPPSEGGMIVYADACRVDAERLASLGIVFKAIPYDVRDA